MLERSAVKVAGCVLRRSKEITCSFSKKKGESGLCFLKFIEQVISLQALMGEGDREVPDLPDQSTMSISERMSSHWFLAGRPSSGYKGLTTGSRGSRLRRDSLRRLF